MMNFTTLAQAHHKLTQQELPFLFELRQQMIAKKPYQGLKILHNTPIAPVTVCKIENLILGGAEVTVTNTKGHPPVPEALAILQEAKVDYQSTLDTTKRYDLHLDCCADLQSLPAPRYGAAELTQTGSIRYKNSKLDYPLISIDDSKIKYLENYLGTGDGFLRGFLQVTKENITDKKFLVFGYGKVGKGIVRALQAYTKNIVVIDNSEKQLALANKDKIENYFISDESAINQQLKDCFCVVTVTGVRNLISDRFPKEIFLGKYLAQMGVEDEFGYKFSNEEVLFNKQPINFALKEPTRVKFLDPVFYAHNIIIDKIIAGEFAPGYHPLPSELDNEILTRWCQYHQVNIEEILRTL